MAAEECGRSLLDPLPPDEPHNKREDGRTSLVTIGG
jgi:hypothetical protein